MATQFAVDSSVAPQVMDFWVEKYKEAKDEVDYYKRLSESKPVDVGAHLQALTKAFEREQEERRYGEKAIVNLLESQPRNTINGTSTYTDEDISHMEAEIYGLKKFMITAKLQANHLAYEAFCQRRALVNRRTPNTNFMPENLVTRPIHVPGGPDPIRTFIAALPEAFSTAYSLCFLPRPPNCLPAHIGAMSSNGWWFHPVWTIQPSWAFQLVIEGNPGEWSYLGRYVTSLLEGCEMKLSEWISLDEETKALYCNRIATERALGEPPSMLDLVETRRRFDIGEWKIPCYLLHCTGFSKELYDALHAAAKSLVSNDTTSSGPSSSSSRSTPLQRSQSLSTEYRSKKRGRGDGADAPVQPAQRPRLTETNFTEVVKRNQKTDAV